MKRRDRTRILVEGDRCILDQMAREVQDEHTVIVVKEPTEELVMLKMREGAQRTQFFLGEALMTSCVVRIGDAFGYGMAMGEDREKAFDLAVVDAAYALDADTCEMRGWSTRLDAEQQRLVQQQRVRDDALLRTQVNFSTMEA